LAGQTQDRPPPTTALGALLSHITGGADASHFQPMNVNFGLFPPLPPSGEKRGKTRGKDRKQLLSARALADLDGWLTAGTRQSAAE
jgi:methylenetetrahydrofolate--tRNA-(uracil-5-)-methyltransferase